MLGIRQIRGEMNISMAKRIDVMLGNASAEDQRRLADNEPLLKKLAAGKRTPARRGRRSAASAIALVGDMQVLVPMAGLIDKDAELARLDKEIARLDGEVKRVGGKLSNAGFVDKAPAEVIDKERPRPRRNRPRLLQEQRDRIATL